jgi:hypothetical protein
MALAAVLPFMALVASLQGADARPRHAAKPAEAVAPRVAGPPIMAIVSLKDQHITIYDADGWVLRAPVSTGQKGRETPAGVFSVIQKEAEHYSNLYDDAFMPHMQRLTWSGIALHGGPLPGRPASHGCIRMPYGFAERLFDKTRLGMRVIIAPADAAPVGLTHALLLSSPPVAETRAAELAVDAAKASRAAEEARLSASNATREAARAAVPVRTLERDKQRADARLAAAEKALQGAAPDDVRLKDAEAKAKADVTDLQTQLDAAKAALQPTLDRVTQARAAAAAAETARVSAAQAAREAAHALEPVSIFVSRKTQHLYVRRGFEPVFDSPVTFTNPDEAIGTHVFTAMARTEAGLRWSAVSVERGTAHKVRTAEVGRRDDGSGAAPAADASAAREALDRVVIPQEVLARLAAMVTPRSSIIVSDEALSRETTKGTEFVAVLSDQPKGSLIVRRRAPTSDFHEARRQYRFFSGHPSFGRNFSPW